MKYSGRRSLAGVLGVLLEQAWRNYSELQEAEILIPIPLHPKRLLERGFNQADELAVALSKRTGQPSYPFLIRHRQTPPQSNLTKPQRSQNVRGAFDVQKSHYLNGRALLLIDDVCTTGSTLSECARVLYLSGARRVSALVLARDLASHPN